MTKEARTEQLFFVFFALIVNNVKKQKYRVTTKNMTLISYTCHLWEKVIYHTNVPAYLIEMSWIDLCKRWVIYLHE